MNITLLGTGNALVTECYNTCFVISNGNRHLLVDGGGGNTLLRQIKHAGFQWQDMREIFVTHRHTDHLLGIIWMMRMVCQHMRQGEYEGDTWIYGHDEVVTLLKELAGKLLQKKELPFIGDRLHMVTVNDGETRKTIGKETTFFDIHSTKAKQYGFTMDLGNGQRLTCCGDEPYNNCEYKYAKGSKWLLHEAFCLHAQADQFHPYEKHHSTVKDACILAEELGIPNLLLYHTEDRNIKNRKELYSAEGREYYHGRLYIPDDLETLTL